MADRGVDVCAACDYLKARLAEPSTWRGIVLILTALGLEFTDIRAEALVTGGLFLAGLIGAAFPDKVDP